MRTVRSKPNMTQEDALVALQRVARRDNMEIRSFRAQGNTWVAKLDKISEFPPSDDEGSEEETPKPPKPPKSEGGESGESEGPPSDLDDDGDDDSSPEGDTDGDAPPFGDEDSKAEGAKGEEKGELRELLSLIHQIADKMGIAPEGGDHMLPTGDEPAGPPLPAPGGPDGPPHGGPDDLAGLGSTGKDGHLPTKLKPGETLPHQTPIGAPAFASAKRSFTIKANVRMSAAAAVKELESEFGPQGYEVKELAPQQDGTYAALLVAKP